MIKGSASSSILNSDYARWSGLVVMIAILWLLLPPFKVVSLDEQGHIPKDVEEVVFDASAYVELFWSESLAPHMSEASDLQGLSQTVLADLSAAKEKYGNQRAEGAAVYFFAKGEGIVRELEGRRATLDVDGVLVNLLIFPPVFGNTVRDSTGLLDVNDFPGLEEFNAVSAALNKKVENDIMPFLKERAQVGTNISFVGCGKAPRSLGEGPALEFIPLRTEVIK